MKVKYQLALLLKFIKKHKNLARLNAYGLSTQRIYLLLALALQKKYINPSDGFFSVSEYGNNWLNKIVLDKANWICQLTNVKINKLRKKEIYLPTAKNSWFET